MSKLIAHQFSGETNSDGYAEDPGLWLEHYLLVADENGWNTDANKISHLPLTFVGEAATWYAVYRTWIRDAARTWTEVEGRFIERFRPSDFQEELEERLPRRQERVFERTPIVINTSMHNCPLHQ